MRRRKSVSLSSELHLVARTIDATRILTEQWKELHLNEDDLPRLARALHATLVLVRERLTLVDRAVRDTLDPRQLFCPENEALDDFPGDEGDVVLHPWSAKKTAEKLRKDADQAERRLQTVRERRQAKESAR
jgi:hypothetical protein